MSRTALTTQDHIYSIEYFAMNNPAFESSHYDVIQLIEQKKLGELSDKEKYCSSISCLCVEKYNVRVM